MDPTVYNLQEILARFRGGGRSSCLRWMLLCVASAWFSEAWQARLREAMEGTDMMIQIHETGWVLLPTSSKWLRQRWNDDQVIQLDLVAFVHKDSVKVGYRKYDGNNTCKLPPSPLTGNMSGSFPRNWQSGHEQIVEASQIQVSQYGRSEGRCCSRMKAKRPWIQHEKE